MEIKKLGELLEVRSGFAFKSKDLSNDNSGIPVIKIGNLVGNEVDYSQTQFVDRNIVNNKVSEFFLENKDVLIAMTGQGSVGRVAQLRKISKDDSLLLNQRVGKFTVNKDILDNDYLFFILSSKAYQDILFSAGSGSGQPNLSPTIIKSIEIPYFDLKTQRKIASLLTSLNDKIENNKRINRNLEKQAQTIFDEEFGQYTVASINSDMSEIPTGWNYCRLDDLCKHIKPGTNYQPKRVEEGIPFLNVRCINSGYINTSDAKFITEEEYLNVHKNWKPEENDILISRIGTLGLVAVIRYEDLPIAVHYNFINIKADKLPFEFMYFLLKSKGFQKAYHLIKKQSVQEYVTIDEVADLKIALPDIKTIDFNQYRDFYKMIVTNQREIRRLTEIRDSLLPKLMSGELDVSDLDI